MTKRNTSDDHEEQNEKLPTWEEFGDKMSELLRSSQEVRLHQKCEKERRESRNNG